MILTTRAVTIEYLEAKLSLPVEKDDSDCDSGGGDGGGGHCETRYHTLGGPSVDDIPSKCAYDANHAVAPPNIASMSFTELVFHPEMSALNAKASLNMPPIKLHAATIGPRASCDKSCQN